jgi:F-type H+-transporting ATPase subunit a
MADKSILSVWSPIGDNVSWLGKKLGEIAPSIKGNHDLNAESLLMLFVALGVAFVLVLVARGKFKDVDKAVIPDEKFTVRTFFEIFLDTVYSLSVGIMGEKNTRTFFPLLATCGVVIFFSNFLGLFPGMLPPTDNLNVTASMAIVIFITTHIVGLKTNGFGHIAHMANPVGEKWGWFLAPLMFPIELIGHIVRPVSLSLRLMGNMIGDHKVLAIFLGLVPLIVPMPFLVLGSIVCLVQTAVFCLLSMVYIGMACEEQHHEEGEAHH